MKVKTYSDKKFNYVLGKYEAIIGAFIFSVLICCIAFASIGVYPFQSRSALIIDGVHQYLGFYEEFCRQLGKSGNWMFSNWGMGHDFYSVFSYYLSSPFSLLVLLLMKFMYVNEAVTIVVLLKIGCIASCMTWYVQKKNGGRNDIALCTGCAYGLCNYVLGYYSNLMWLDCVMMLPVLAWSIEKLVNCGCWKRYTIVLEYCIISNYYFGFMLCVFAVLYYLAVYIGSQDRRDSWIKSVLKFAGASVLSAGIAAVILFPAIFTVKDTAAAQQISAPLLTEKYGNIWGQLSRLLFDSYPYATSSDQGSVNIYCGCAMLFFVVLYFLNNSIYWKKKIAMVGLLLFYFAGFHFALLNYVLHGLHKPVGMPNRFAFIVIFLLLSIGSEGWGRAKNVEKVLQAAGVALILLFCGMVDARIDNTKVIISAGIILLYFLLILESSVVHKKKVYQTLWNMLILIVFLGEIGTHAILSIQHTGSAHRSLYEASGRELNNFLRNKKDSRIYRTDIVNPMLRNEEILYNLNGIAMFSSTNTQKMQNWMARMGFETGKNRFQYTGGTEVTDMLLGIRYLACRKNINFDTSYKRVNSGMYFDLYKNERTLGNAYLVDYQMKDFRLRGGNPMEIQNNLLEKMGCGMLYELNMVKPISYQFAVDGSVYEIKLKGGQHGYLWLGGAEPNIVDVEGRIQDCGGWNNNFLDLGYSNADRIIRVDVSKHSGMAILGTFDKARIDAIYQKLHQNEVQIKNGKGRVVTAQRKVLYMPVFYNKGFKIQIDGKPAEVLDLDGMTGIDIPTGSHDIKITYETRGFKAGAAISVISLIALFIFMKNNKKEVER